MILPKSSKLASHIGPGMIKDIGMDVKIGWLEDDPAIPACGSEMLTNSSLACTMHRLHG